VVRIAVENITEEEVTGLVVGILDKVELVGWCMREWILLLGMILSHLGKTESGKKRD
jgi:hypothetical protein